MNNPLTVQYALMCLQDLGEHASKAVSSQEISRRQGIPLPQCEDILERLENASLIDSPESEHFSLNKPIEDFKVLEILDALSRTPKKAPAFRLLYQAGRPALRKTLEMVSCAQSLSCFPSDGPIKVN